MNRPSRAKDNRFKSAVGSDVFGCRCKVIFAGTSSQTAKLAFFWIVAVRLLPSVSVCGKHGVRREDDLSFGFHVSLRVRGLH